jgi:DNA-binding MarR family transcriptional regulator
MQAVMHRLVHQHAKALSMPGPESDMTRTQLTTLFRIGRDATTTMGTLADELDIAPGSLTGIVDRLIEKGFVRRDRDAADRRKVVVALSDQGLAAFSQFQLAEGRFTEKMFSLLTPEEGTILVGLMERLVGGMEAGGGSGPRAAGGRPDRS